MKTEKNNIHDYSLKILGIDAFETEVPKIAQVARRLRPKKRSEIASNIYDLLQMHSRKFENERITAAKILVAFLPESLDTIQRLLQTRSDRWFYELHFSLFCFLEESLEIKLSAAVRKKILRYITEYLVSAKTNTAHATWMAGHLLGGHWELRAASKTLLELATKGLYATGRRGAVQGLQDMLHRVNSTQRKTIIRTLQKISLHDRSKELRSYVKWIMPPAKP